MIGTATGGGRARPSKGSAIAGFLPWFLRRAPSGPFTGILARELRYWVRDPRRRVGLISVGVAGIITPLAVRLNNHSPGFGGPPLSLTASFAGILGGVLLLQVFSFDGTAYATHILAGVRPRTEIAARAAGVAILVAPLIVIVTAVVGLVIGRLDDLPIALGTALGSFGSSLGAACALAVVASYPLPETRNMFAMNTGTGSARGLIGFVVIVGTLIMALPVYVLAFFLPSTVELIFGVLWGAAAVAGGIALGAARLRGHGPELLLAVTPRR